MNKSLERNCGYGRVYRDYPGLNPGLYRGEEEVRLDEMLRVKLQREW